MNTHFIKDVGFEDYFSYLQSDASAIRLLAMELDDCSEEDRPDKAHTLYVLAEDQMRLLKEVSEKCLGAKHEEQ